MRSLTNDAVFHQVRLDLSIERALVTFRKGGMHLTDNAGAQQD